MPYIEQHRRAAIDAGGTPIVCGELNYALCMLAIKHSPEFMYYDLVRQYLHEQDVRSETGLRYQHINDAMGAMDGACRELHRRRPGVYTIQITALQNAARDIYSTVAAPYEDGKIAQTGDLPW